MRTERTREAHLQVKYCVEKVNSSSSRYAKSSDCMSCAARAIRRRGQAALQSDLPHGAAVVKARQGALDERTRPVPCSTSSARNRT